MTEEAKKDIEESRKETGDPRKEASRAGEEGRGTLTYEERMSVLKRRVKKLKAGISDEAKSEADSK